MELFLLLSFLALQWIENTEREDLSLKDRIDNVKTIVNEYKQESGVDIIRATLLKELIGISLPQATCYIAVLNAPDDVTSQIRTGKINNLDKAAYIAKIESSPLREKLIAACTEGSSLKQLKSIVEHAESIQKPSNIGYSVAKNGIATKKINLGYVYNPNPIRRIITYVLQQPQYKHHEKDFMNIAWEQLDQVATAFQQLLLLLNHESDA